MGDSAVVSLNEYKYEKFNYNLNLRQDTVLAHKEEIRKTMVKAYLKLLSDKIK